MSLFITHSSLPPRRRTSSSRCGASPWLPTSCGRSRSRSTVLEAPVPENKFRQNDDCTCNEHVVRQSATVAQNKYIETYWSISLSLYIYIYMYTYTFIHICVCIYIYMYIYVCIYTYVRNGLSIRVLIEQAKYRLVSGCLAQGRKQANIYVRNGAQELDFGAAPAGAEAWEALLFSLSLSLLLLLLLVYMCVYIYIYTCVIHVLYMCYTCVIHVI